MAAQISKKRKVCMYFLTFNLARNTHHEMKGADVISDLVNSMNETVYLIFVKEYTDGFDEKCASS